MQNDGAQRVRVPLVFCLKLLSLDLHLVKEMLLGDM
jgi:hypothetical protein